MRAAREDLTAMAGEIASPALLKPKDPLIMRRTASKAAACTAGPMARLKRARLGVRLACLRPGPALKPLRRFDSGGVGPP